MYLIQFWIIFTLVKTAGLLNSELPHDVMPNTVYEPVQQKYNFANIIYIFIYSYYYLLQQYAIRYV